MTKKMKGMYQLHAFDATQAHMTGTHFGSLSHMNDRMEKKALGKAVPNGPKQR